MHLTANRPTFSRSEVIVLTNKRTGRQTDKQTPLKAYTSLRYAAPVYARLLSYSVHCSDASSRSG